MAVPTIVVYSYSSNRNVIRLLDKGEPVSLKSVQQLDLKLDNGRIISSLTKRREIQWDVDDEPHAKGNVYLELGREFLITRDYIADVLVYDDLNSLGVFWGYIRIRGIEGGVRHE